MRRFLILWAVINLWLSACGNVPINPDVDKQANNTPTPTIQTAISTPTLTPVGTWETAIEGVVYDKSAGSEKPIEGAAIVYDVLHTYYPELQEGRPNQTTSDENGTFSLRIMVHDTDSVKVVIQAKGYTPFEERLTGVDLVVGKKYEVGLSPEQ